MTWRRFASEFPNDNPELHDGAVFVCLSLCAPPRAIWRPRGVSLPSEPAPIEPEPEPLLEAEALPPIEPEQAPLLEAEPRTPPEPEPAPLLEAEPPAADPPALETEPESPQTRDVFGDFVQALVDVALNAGATRAAIWLPDLLESGTICCDGAQADVLVERGVLERTAAGLVPKPRLMETARAWRQVLRAESDDLSACGASTLDAWGAELIGILSGKTAAGIEDLRRELRRRGVAAFGMLSLAA